MTFLVYMILVVVNVGKNSSIRRPKQAFGEDARKHFKYSYRRGAAYFLILISLLW